MIKATLTIYYNKGQHKTHKQTQGLLKLLHTTIKLYYFKDFPAKLVIEKRQDESNT